MRRRPPRVRPQLYPTLRPAGTVASVAATPAAVGEEATFEKHRPVTVTLHGEARPRPADVLETFSSARLLFLLTGRMCPRADHSPTRFTRGAALT